MDSLLEDLLMSLDEETTLYQDLLFVLQKEKEAVVGLAVDDLNESTKEKETLALKAKVFEEIRLGLLKRLAKELEIPSDELTLSCLCNVVNEPYSGRLKTSRSNLLSLSSSIQEINRINESLIMHSLDSIAGSISLLCNFMSSGSTYLDTGRLQHGSKDGCLVEGQV